MKYMGSKRYMLSNGLGKLILKESKKSKRFVDLFCGAGSVAYFAAEKTSLPVLATDLQQYSVILTKSIICRNQPINTLSLVDDWLNKVEKRRCNNKLWQMAQELEDKLDGRRIRKYVMDCRELCEQSSRIGPIWKAYGGHYFSPKQALTFDYLIKLLPKEEQKRTACLAATITAGSRCAASPGHTAQPFQPTKTARRFILESWKKDPTGVCKRVLEETSSRYAKKIGNSYVADAIEQARELNSDDLVLIDPPYSGVQYSRFYHVLETIAKGKCGEVSGVGRYPNINERPQSSFSNRGQSKDGLKKLLANLSKSGVRVILTFPEEECSNGLSGKEIMRIASEYFQIEKKIVKGKFSTLGGNNKYRASRKDSSELILLMRSK